MLSDERILDALPAFQRAVSDDFARVWNADATLVFTEQTPFRGWEIEIVDNPGCWFCAGYHDVRDGVPYSEVGAYGDTDWAWQVTFTHELFELLADPYINRGVLVGKKWYALEVADPVEADNLAYPRPGLSGTDVWISDFVTENWFRRGSVGPYDFAGHVTRPLQVLPGGYQLIWRNGAWTWPHGRIPE